MFTASLFSKIDFIEHCFFGRDYYRRFGGKSLGYYQALNVSYKLGDKIEDVNHNRELIAKHFGLSKSQLITFNQVHSNIVTEVNNSHNYEDFANVESDGLITKDNNIVLGVTTADCIPILMVDVNNKIVSAIHCGWKGLLYGIIDNNIAKHYKLANNTPNILVAIGPCIKQESYNVKVDFYDNFYHEDKNSQAFFKHQDSGDFLFDLVGYAKFRLMKAGILENNIEILKNDTFVEEEIFFSHRRMTIKKEIVKGLQLSCIKLKS